ncbi:MAG: hypothetical protein WCC66_10850 [Rhizobiaceae bacterium]
MAMSFERLISTIAVQHVVPVSVVAKQEPRQKLRQAVRRLWKQKQFIIGLLSVRVEDR